MSAHDWPEYLEVVKGIDGCDIGLSKEEYIFARNAINDRDELERKIILAEQQRDALQQRCEELVSALVEKDKEWLVESGFRMAWQHCQQELDAARRDVDALRQRSLVNSRVADGRLKEIERLRGALHRINDFRSNDNDDFAEFACKTAEQALAAQQEAG